MSRRSKEAASSQAAVAPARSTGGLTEDQVQSGLLRLASVLPAWCTNMVPGDNNSRSLIEGLDMDPLQVFKMPVHQQPAGRNTNNDIEPACMLIVPSKCSIATGVTFNRTTGYSSVLVGPGTQREAAHRLVCKAIKGHASNPSFNIVCHSCGNRTCVQPAHLVWGDLDANHYSKEQRKQTLEDIEGFEE
jgi:hypothetical protein